MKNILFEGVATALVTPFNHDGSLDLTALEQLIEFQIANGISAIVIAGTTGEASTLTFEEFSLLVSKTNEYINKRVPLIVGTGSNNTAHALKLSLEAEKRGANGLLMVTPYYNKTTQAGLIAHYTHIADRVNIPIIIYNVPSRTGLNIAPETCKQLSEHRNIYAIKEASGNISATMDILQTAPDLALYSGNDDQMLPILAIGGKGVISVIANITPREMVNLYDAFKNAELEKAIRIQNQLLPLMRALFSQVNPIPVKKAVQLIGYSAGSPRLPLMECDRATEEKLKYAMRKAGI